MTLELLFSLRRRSVPLGRYVVQTVRRNPKVRHCQRMKVTQFRPPSTPRYDLERAGVSGLT
ncbi:MAG: hypothetical protein QM784_33330 [Polyangiaceae bacterium]